MLQTGKAVGYPGDATCQLTHEKRSGVNSYDVTHIYEDDGNKTVKIDSGARTTVTFDAANRKINGIDGTGRTTFVFEARGPDPAVR